MTEPAGPHSVPAALLEGYQAFVRGRLRDEQSRFAQLADHGQSPKVLVIGCCDSRVSPEVIFNARPGELFVVRNIANLVPPHDAATDAGGVAAALEYGIQALRVAHVVVLGHARCGGVRAFADGAIKPFSPSDYVGKWMSLLAEAADEVNDDQRAPLDAYCARLERASLRRSLANLRTYPCIQHLEASGRLTVHALYFGIATGELFVLDEEHGCLRQVPAGARAGMRPMRAQALEA